MGKPIFPSIYSEKDTTPMKKSISLLALLLLLISSSVSAQCVPDTLTYPNAGYYPLPPGPLPGALVTVPYSQVITINTPLDTTVDLSNLIGFPFPPITATVVQQDLGVVNGLPIGFFGTPTPFSGIILGGQSGCLDINGTTSTAGQYVCNIPVTITILVPNTVPVIGGTTQNLPLQLAYNLQVSDPNAVHPAMATGFTVSQSLPNPASGTTVIRYSVTGISDMQLEVVDLTGKTLLRLSQKNVSGEHSFRFDVSDWAPGLYLYRLSDGKNKIAKKMIIE